MKIGLIINGAAGRMGRRVAALAAGARDFEVAGAVERDGHPDIGRDIGVLAGIEPVGITLTNEYPDSGDVVIDFSLPEASDKTVDFCARKGKPLISATTGLNASQLEGLQKLSEKVPVVRASNFSVGMNVLFTLIGRVAETLGVEYDIEVVEAHHRFKKDAPSGTALTLAENIARQTGRDWPGCLVHGRNGKDAMRKKDTIGIHAIRAGDIVGEHSVMFSTLGETLTLTHRAHSRDTFAQGALRAARWISAAEPGLYSMTNVLDLA